MKNKMWEIGSFNFTFGYFLSQPWNAAEMKVEDAKQEIDAMVEKCAVNTITFAFVAMQDRCNSTRIDWQGSHMVRDSQLSELVRYAKSRNLKTIFKPMVNVRDGNWRAHIRFLDEDVPGEPTWGEWFRNYTDYMKYYGAFCEKEGVDMIILGCEMIGTDHRQNEWRALIKEVRKVYSGLLTYNCDKYQEHNVKWWDALDAISSSGYYAIDVWDRETARLEAVARQYGKPLFFAEGGTYCMEGGSLHPASPRGNGGIALEEQDRFYKAMFEACEKCDWHYGYSLWDWPIYDRAAYDPLTDKRYVVLDKPAQETIKHYFSKMKV